jgi:hypothetical protein
VLDFFRARYAGLLAHIRDEKTLPDGMAEAVAEFKAAFTPTVSGEAPSADVTATDAEELADATSDKTLATE